MRRNALQHALQHVLAATFVASMTSMTSACGLLNGTTDGSVGPFFTLFPDFDDDGSGALSCEDSSDETFTTDDGIDIQYDFLAPSTDEDIQLRGVILLHETPSGGFDRTRWGDYPFTLRDRNFAVLNLDRRGAGGSGEGDADGADGWLDLQGALLKMEECGVPAGAIGVMAASTGTTSLYDYLNFHQNEDGRAADGLPAFVMLSAGEWTDVNTSGDFNGSALDGIPGEMIFSDDDDPVSVVAWNGEVQGNGVPAGTNMFSIPGSAHGTEMLTEQNAIDPNQNIGDFLADFMDSSF